MVIENWQKGFELSELLAVLPKFDAYNRFALGPFVTVGKHHVADFLHKNELHELDNLLVYRKQIVKAASTIRIFPNRNILGIKEKGDIFVSKISLINDSENENNHKIRKHFSEIGENIWFECMAEDRKLCSIIDTFAERIGTKVDTFGNLQAYFFRGVRSHSKNSSLERITISELKIQKNILPLVESIQTKLKILPEFANHHSNYNKKKSWSAISLQGYSSDVSFIGSPNEKRIREKAIEPFLLQETELMKDFHEVQELISLIGGQVERVRFMKLKSGEGELTRHTDLEDKVFGLNDGDVMRIHFPIVTNPDVKFSMWNLDGVEENHQMKIGKGYFLDTRKPHSAINAGDEERTHLVIDAYTNETLLGLLTNDKSKDIDGFYKFNKEKKTMRKTKGEKIDREKMDELKAVLENYVYDDNAEKIIFGDEKKSEPNYKIFIPKDDWASLKKKYEDKVFNGSTRRNKYLKLALSDLIDKYKIPIPWKPITLEEAKKDFVKLAHDPEMFKHLSPRHQELKELRRRGKIGTRSKKSPRLYAHELIRTNMPIFYKFDFKNVKPLDTESYFIKSSNDGNKASNYFFQKHRLGVGSRHQEESPYEAWANKKYRKKIMEAFWSLEKNIKHLDSSMLKQAVNAKVYVASAFKPSVAKTLYRLFDAKNVIDPSMGWGDRLTGFLATPHTERYLGTDPFIALHDEYEKQIELYGKALEPLYGIQKKVEHLKLPAEDVPWNDYKEQFDFVFTSPPYFDTEQYSDDEGQSFLNYTTLDSWLTDFLFKVIDGTWLALQDGGILALNITDQHFSNNKGVNKICDPMNDYISQKTGASFIGCIGMEMGTRTGQGQNQPPKNSVNCEPIFVWGKNTGGKTVHDYVQKKIDAGVTYDGWDD